MAHRVLRALFKVGFHTVSASDFSTENWGRHKDLIVSERKLELLFIGDLTKIPESFLRTVHEVEEDMKSHKKKHRILAIDYSGRFDILHACKSIVKKSEKGLIREEDVDKTVIERELLTNCTEFQSPDLLMRTIGEQRISNFFLWQLAYTELFFSPILWQK